MSSDKKYFLFPKPHFNHLFFIFYFISSLTKQYILRDMKEQDNLSQFLNYTYMKLVIFLGQYHT